MAGCMLVGSGLGVAFSVLLLFFGIPGLLGQEYLREYGGTKEFSVFRPEILIAAVGFTLLIIEAAIQKNMNRMIRLSCIESMHYTGKQNHSRKRRNTEKQKTEKQNARKRRKIPAELPLLAWRNVTRERAEFVLTVLSLFLGVETLLCTAVVTGGSDATNIYMQKPDFILAGDFCEEAKEGIISEPDEEALDPLVTDANTADLLWNNKTDDFAPDFAPISESVRKKILALKGVDQDRTECAEGAYMNVVISEKGWSPFSDEYFRVSAESSDEGETETDAERSDTEMERSGFPETVHILSEKEMDSLKEYAEEKNLSVDMASVEDGSGVLIYQEYGFTPEQKKMTEEVKGEPVSFCSSGSEYEKESAEIFTLNGYLDGRAKDFPELKLGWHGENMLFFLVSEKGFERLGIEKEIIYMEVNVKVGRSVEVQRTHQVYIVGVELCVPEKCVERTLYERDTLFGRVYLRAVLFRQRDEAVPDVLFTVFDALLHCGCFLFRKHTVSVEYTRTLLQVVQSIRTFPGTFALRRYVTIHVLRSRHVVKRPRLRVRRKFFFRRVFL